jgi:hypothetical protein
VREKINKLLQVLDIDYLPTNQSNHTPVAQFFFYIIVFTLEFARIHSY